MQTRTIEDAIADTKKLEELKKIHDGAADVLAQTDTVSNVWMISYCGKQGDTRLYQPTMRLQKMLVEAVRLYLSGLDQDIAVLEHRILTGKDPDPETEKELRKNA